MMNNGWIVSKSKKPDFFAFIQKALIDLEERGLIRSIADPEEEKEEIRLEDDIVKLIICAYPDEIKKFTGDLAAKRRLKRKINAN